MPRRILIVLAFLSGFLIPRCSVIPMKPTPTPVFKLDDLVLRYHWREGSIPPPYHYEYDIRIGPGKDGDIVFHPDYPGKDTPTWTEPFTITDAQRASLIQLVRDNQISTRQWHPLQSPRIGGSLASMDVSAGDLRVSVPSQLEDADAAIAGTIYDAVRALVPQVIWDSLMQRREQYMAEHDR